MHNAILIARPFVTSGDSFADKQDPLIVGNFANANASTTLGFNFYTYS